MKKKALPVLLAGFVIAAFFGGCRAKEKIPAFLIAEATYDFGVVDEGKSINHVFEFTNSGTGTLLVEKVQPACGCTVAGEYDQEVKPGQQGQIAVSFNSTGFESFIAKPIVVKTNIPDHPDIVLSIQGIVKVAVNLSPKTLDLGEIERTRTAPSQESSPYSTARRNPCGLPVSKM